MIILPAHCSNEHNSEGANIAAVYVNLKEAVKRTALMAQIKKKDRSVAKLCFWDDNVLFYHLNDAQLAKLVIAADAKIEDQLFFRKPDDILEEFGNPIRTDCDMATVWNKGELSWSAYDHYCEDRMETEMIHLETIQKLMQPKRGK